jgi:tRNA(Ile)-lysidine synthase TilS/MesJ
VRATRADVLLHLQRNEIEHASDPSNADTRFLRVRVRTEVLPLLRELSPTIVESLGALADALEGASADDPLVGLGRRQRAVIDHAKSVGRRKVTVRVDDSREVVVSLTDPAPTISEVLSTRSRRSRSD